MQNHVMPVKTVSFKWTATLFLAFCFMLYAHDSKSNSHQQADSEITLDMISESE